MQPKTRAEKSAAVMWSNDAASKWMGFDIDWVAEGKAQLSMQVKDHHCNGHGICHGGIIFALADSAFAFACNSRNQSTVAQQNSITFVAPAQLGDRLIATASELSLAGRSGLYDVTVTTGDERLIAAFRGLSRQIKGALFIEQGEE